MLILLPPSEGKTTPGSGTPVDHAGLWLPRLAPARRRVAAKLVSLSKRTSARAVQETLQVLGLSDGQRDELGRNAVLQEAPAAPAADVYTGVLYAALDANSLAGDARAWLDESAVVFSGLWGVVRPADRIPAYRCSVGVTLPAPIGGLTAYWKKVLKPALDPAAAGGPVLDLRSGAYAAMWTPPAGNSATVRVLHERVVGGVAKRSIVSHFNKATKGRMVRALAEATAAPASIDEVVAALRDLKYQIEEQPAGAGKPRQLDVIVPEL
ncbi:peroxide stress protein YaaA [Actinoplanes sp. KI2]|uniref:peroxide stress protein YaaA n=1 Tax=Actinoplanes sp. KI2 TaxID=2983315 RepID=UPI0021D5D5FA|nr:peroxide stress protein YaaA [Actinoplanes sp. KI2]MCU7722652.1 peroxide stress protein YaaA [Actinoplanes sp. KI2]